MLIPASQPVQGPLAELVFEALETWVINVQSPSPETNTNCSLDLKHALRRYSVSPEAAEDGGERVAKVVWVTAFTNYLASNGGKVLSLELVLLENLLERNRWRVLFEAADTALDFVRMIVEFIENHSRPWNNALGEAMLNSLQLAMAEWIEDEGVVQGGQLRTIATALFGEPWCDLIYDSKTPELSLSDLLLATKPEFLPGRLTSTLEPTAALLPELT